MAKVKDIQPNTVRSLIALWESSISTAPSTTPTSVSARHHKSTSPSHTVLDPSQTYPISSVPSSEDSNNVKLYTSERSAADLMLTVHETDRVDIEKEEVPLSDSGNFKRTDSATEVSATATTNSPTPDDDIPSVKSFKSESAEALSQSNPTNIENLELTKQSEITLSDAQEFICDKVDVPDNDNQEADTISVMEQQEIVEEDKIINQPPKERDSFDKDPIDDKTICEKHSQESFSTQSLREETTVCEPSSLKREIARHESFFALQDPKKAEPQEQAQRRQFHQSFIDHVVQLNISQKRLRGLSRWFFHTVNGITIPKQSLVNGALPTETSTIVSEQFNKIVRSISKSLENPIPTETKVLIVEKVIRVAEVLSFSYFHFSLCLMTAV
ncbi:hypothetical protein BKA69DRAFT_81959 [Paraphysoderma sedebokerense]|nr:hypothetical protein BKA69DRAFT_81959 [Paraphysoderma sedebokerense]